MAPRKRVYTDQEIKGEEAVNTGQASGQTRAEREAYEAEYFAEHKQFSSDDFKDLFENAPLKDRARILALIRRNEERFTRTSITEGDRMYAENQVPAEKQATIILTELSEGIQKGYQTSINEPVYNEKTKRWERTGKRQPLEFGQSKIGHPGFEYKYDVKSGRFTAKRLPPSQHRTRVENVIKTHMTVVHPLTKERVLLADPDDVQRFRTASHQSFYGKSEEEQIQGANEAKRLATKISQQSSRNLQYIIDLAEAASVKNLRIGNAMLKLDNLTAQDIPAESDRAREIKEKQARFDRFPPPEARLGSGMTSADVFQYQDPDLRGFEYERWQLRKLKAKAKGEPFDEEPPRFANALRTHFEFEANQLRNRLDTARSGHLVTGFGESSDPNKSRFVMGPNKVWEYRLNEDAKGTKQKTVRLDYWDKKTKFDRGAGGGDEAYDQIVRGPEKIITAYDKDGNPYPLRVRPIEERLRTKYKGQVGAKLGERTAKKGYNPPLPVIDTVTGKPITYTKEVFIPLKGVMKPTPLRFVTGMTPAEVADHPDLAERLKQKPRPGSSGKVHSGRMLAGESSERKFMQMVSPQEGGISPAGYAAATAGGGWEEVGPEQWAQAFTFVEDSKGRIKAKIRPEWVGRVKTQTVEDYVKITALDPSLMELKRGQKDTIGIKIPKIGGRKGTAARDAISSPSPLIATTDPITNRKSLQIKVPGVGRTEHYLTEDQRRTILNESVKNLEQRYVGDQERNTAHAFNARFGQALDLKEKMIQDGEKQFAGIPFADDIDLHAIAQRAKNSSPEDLINLTEQAARRAAARGSSVVAQEDLEKSLKDQRPYLGERVIEMNFGNGWVSDRLSSAVQTHQEHQLRKKSFIAANTKALGAAGATALFYNQKKHVTKGWLPFQINKLWGGVLNKNKGLKHWAQDKGVDDFGDLIDESQIKPLGARIATGWQRILHPMSDPFGRTRPGIDFGSWKYRTHFFFGKAAEEIPWRKVLQKHDQVKELLDIKTKAEKNIYRTGIRGTLARHQLHGLMNMQSYGDLYPTLAKPASGTLNKLLSEFEDIALENPEGSKAREAAFEAAASVKSELARWTAGQRGSGIKPVEDAKIGEHLWERNAGPRHNEVMVLPKRENALKEFKLTGPQKAVLIGGAALATAAGAHYAYHKFQQKKLAPEDRTAYYNKILPPPIRVPLPHLRGVAHLTLPNNALTREFSLAGRKPPVAFGVSFKKHKIWGGSPEDRGYDKNAKIGLLGIRGNFTTASAPLLNRISYDPDLVFNRKKVVKPEGAVPVIKGHKIPLRISISKQEKIKLQTKNPNRLTNSDREDIAWAFAGSADEDRLVRDFFPPEDKVQEMIADEALIQRLRRKHGEKFRPGRLTGMRAAEKITADFDPETGEWVGGDYEPFEDDIAAKIATPEEVWKGALEGELIERSKRTHERIPTGYAPHTGRGVPGDVWHLDREAPIDLESVGLTRKGILKEAEERKKKHSKAMAKGDVTAARRLEGLSPNTERRIERAQAERLTRRSKMEDVFDESIREHSPQGGGPSRPGGYRQGRVKVGQEDVPRSQLDEAVPGGAVDQGRVGSRAQASKPPTIRGIRGRAGQGGGTKRRAGNTRQKGKGKK